MKLSRITAAIATFMPVAAYADPVTIVVGLANAFGTYIVGSQFVGFMLTVAAAALGGAYQRRKIRKQEAAARAEYNASLQDRSVSVLRSDPPWQVIYGEAIVGGAVLDIFTTDKNGYDDNGNAYTKPDALKHLVIRIASHECQSIEEAYIDGNSVGALNAAGYATAEDFVKARSSSLSTATQTNTYVSSVPIKSAKVWSGTEQIVGEGDRYVENYAEHTFSLSGDKLTMTIDGAVPSGGFRLDLELDTTVSSVRLKYELGTDSQTTNSYLASLNPTRYTANHRLRGICYAVLTVDLEDTRFQGGPPNIQFRVKGRKVFDPRTSLTAWSNNPALCIRDVLINAWGPNVSASDVNDTFVIAAANICDETINLQTTDGTTTTTTQGPRYTCDGAFTTENSIESVLEDMANSMAGFVTYTGEWLVWAGKWSSSALTLNDDDLAGQIEIIQADTKSDDLFNGVRGQYIPAGVIQPTDIPPYQNPSFVTVDGKELWTDVDLAWTNHPSRARNLCRIMVEQNRLGEVIRYPAKMKAWPLQIGDRVTINSTTYGFSSRTYRVTDWQFDNTSSVVLTLQRDVAETWNLADAAYDRLPLNTDLPDPWNVPALTGLTATSGSSETFKRLSDGTLVSMIKVAWTRSSQQYVLNNGFVDVQWALIGTNSFQKARVPGDSNFFFIDGVKKDQRYRIRVRQVTSMDAVSDWTTTTHLVLPKSTVPANVTGLGATFTNGALAINWTASTDPDYRYTEIRVGGTGWANATLIFRGAANSFTYPVGVAQTYTLRAKHFDNYGFESATAASANVTVTETQLASSALSLTLSTYSFPVACDSAGTPVGGAFTGAVSTVQVTRGGTNDTSNWTISKVDTGVTSTVGGTAGAPTVSVTAISGDVGYVDITATRANFPTLTARFSLSKSKQGVTGSNGTRTAILDMYRWSASAPVSFPSGSSTYTWATGQFTAPATPNGWSLTPPAPVAGQTLYVVRQVFSDTGTSLTSSVAWSATTSMSLTSAGSDGTAGTNGQRVGFLELYRWSAASPTTYPSGTSTYTWATGAFTAPGTLNGWSLTPGAAVTGQTLWGISVRVSDNLTSATSTATWNSTTPYPVGYAGTDGQNAKGLRLRATTQAFRISAAGANSPASITLTASGQNLVGSPTFSTNPSVTLTTVDSVTRTLSFANMGSNDSVAVTVDWDGLTDVLSVYRLREGTNAITPVMSNVAHPLPSDVNGNVSSYTGSGTTIRVFEGSTALNYVTSLATGTFTIGTPTISPAASITVGGISGNGTSTATVAAHSAASAAQDVITITYPLTVRRADGTDVTVNLIQTLTKAKQGAQGGTGSTGAQGASNRIAYALYSGNPTSVLWDGSLPQITLTGDVLPGAATASNPDAATAWTATPQTPASGQSLFMSNGNYNPATNQTTWNAPFLANFRVGSLSAISADLGSITAGSIDIGSGKAVIPSTGYAVFKGIRVEDESGNVILQTRTGSASTVPAAWLDSAVVSNASNGNSAFSGTANYRNNVAPTNNAAFGTLAQVNTADGNVVVTVPYTYTQGAVPADLLYVFYREGGGTVVASNPAFATNASSGSVLFTLKPSTTYTFGLQAVRRTETGLVGTSILTSGSLTTNAANFTGNVNSVAASTITTAVTNFNSSNDRNNAAVTAPTILSDGSAVDHTINADGAADISFEWAWAGNEGDIDGFQVFVYSAATNAAYTFGTTPAAEQVYELPANKRAVILYGMAANRWYKFGVRAYRKVDKDINAAGVILSTLVIPSLAAENPYQPSSSVAFTGNVTGTVNGIAATNVNVWASITGTGKPQDNATVGADADNFTGVIGGGNLLYNASFEADSDSDSRPDGWAAVGTFTGVTYTRSLDNTIALHGGSSFKLDVTAVNGATTTTNQHPLLDNTGGPNYIPCAPGDQFVLSVYARTSTLSYRPAVAFSFYDAADGLAGSITTSTQVPTAINTWERYVFRGTAPAGAAYVRPRLVLIRPSTADTTIGTIWFDEAQLEQGNVVTAWAPGVRDKLGIDTPLTEANKALFGYTGSLDATRNQIFRQSTAPTSVVAGDLWFNTSASTVSGIAGNTFARYNGASWDPVANNFTNTLQMTNDAGWTRNVVTRSGTAPSTPANGDVWIDTSLTPNVTKVYVSGAWQNASTLGATFTQGQIGTIQGVIDAGNVDSYVSANVIKASHLAANSILASKIVVTDSTNLFPDFDFNDTAFYSTPDSAVYSFTGTTGSALGARLLRITSLGAGTVRSGWFPIEQSKQYWAEAAAWNSVAENCTVSASLELASVDASGNMTVLTTVPVASRNNSTSSTRLTTFFTAGATEKRARWVMTRAAGAQEARFGGLMVRRRNEGNLIVDGSIVADKLASNSVTADKIEANAITAAKISAGAITASKLTISDASNIYPDFDLLDTSFYASSNGATYSFVKTASNTNGAQLLSITTNGVVQVESGYFPIESSADYRIEGSAFLQTADGTTVTTLDLELASIDASGVITPVRTVTVGSRTNSTNGTRLTLEVATAASERRARFIAKRTAGTSAARFGGFIVRRRYNGTLIVNGSITADKINATNLSGIFADLGTITSGTITLNSTGHIKSGQTAYNTGTGFWLGMDGATAKFSIGSASGSNLTWDGTNLSINTTQTNIVTTGIKSNNVNGFSYAASGSSSIDIEFGTDGRIRRRVNGGSYTNYVNYYDPTTTSIGSSYWIRFTRANGVTPDVGGALINVWSQLNSARVVGMTRNATGTDECQLNYEISSASDGSVIVASGTIFLISEFNT